ncbi:uncharacterized protein LOC135391294 [Ornithodoros turicata]|uniref:uncharacterized protein LOC135391294 n=1 Tax=Ornithodoros turicata TaxID=34597 RepID=UPI003139A02C
MLTLCAQPKACAAQNCFGGIETFEKTTGFAFSSSVSGQTLLQQPDQALTRDCINLCKQQSQCLTFSLNYVGYRCASFNLNSVGRRELLVTSPSTNFFEKICFRGVQKTTFDALCGDRLWAFERVKEGHLEGFVDKEEHNVKDKEECAKMCLLEEGFPCRSADYDEITKICRMSREDRRSQPQAFRQVPGNSRDYLENQCAATAPTSCRYETRVGVGVVSMDLLQFATAVDDCQTQCDRETTFNCRAYSYMENRCYLSGDDTISLGPSGLPAVTNAAYGEKKCITEQCTLGVFTYEKMTGFVMRSAARTAIPLSSPGALGNTLECRQFCQMAGLDCPAFSVNYQNMRCDKLDRNSQGRTQELTPRAGENYFEKICLRGNFATACQGKAWAYERVLGMELVPTLYDKSFAHVQSRRDCEEFCLNEQSFNCRSAVYFDDTAECRLSRHDRRTQPDGVIKSSNPRINYLENQCLEVSPTCPYEKTADAYPVYTDVVQMTGIVSEQSCDSFCTTYPNFNCRSFAYYPSNGQCFISGEDRISAGPGNTNSRPGILFYERSCKDGAGTTDGTTSGGTASTGQTPGSLPPTFPTAQTAQTPTLFPPTARQCSAGDKLTFARVSGFESPTRPGPVLLTAPADGMTKECVLRCEQRDDCRSFTIDYRRHECYIAGYYGGPVPAHLRPSPGKSYFEGICVPGKYGCGACRKLWTIERMVDQELRGVSPRDVSRFITLHDCERRCIEELRFPCAAASFDMNLQECRLYSEDRNSRFARLIYGRGVYYLENQCTVNTGPCLYAPIQRDVYMTHITRVVHGVSSTFQCEMECNREPDFNCRSYTYIEHGTLGPPQCLLSADSRQSVAPVVLEFRSRALYGEKDCHLGDDGRANGISATRPPPPPPQLQPFPTFQPGPAPGPGPFPPPVPTGGPQPGPPAPPLPPYPPPFCRFDQYTYEKTLGHDLRYVPRERVPTRANVGVVQDAYTECQRLGDRCRAFTVEYGNFQTASWLSTAAEDNRQLLTANPVTAYFEKICLHERTCGKMWVFERTLNHEMRGAPDREIPATRRRGECQDLCLRERSFVCRAATYQSSRHLCRLFSENRRTNPAAFARTAEEVDYMENLCAPEASTCQYRESGDRFLPIIDRLSHAFNLAECQRQCDLERRFSCRAVNFETIHKDCALSSEDTQSTPLGTAAMVFRRFSIYSEKGTCEQVSVQCNQQDMLLSMNFDTPFHGRVYAKGNPGQCYVVGNGQNNLQFAVSLGTRCGTLQEGDGRYANEVVVQQHPIIMTDTDRNIRVVCSFDAGDRTVTLASTFARNGAHSGLDVTTRGQPTITSVVTNTAPPPNVVMRILDPTGRDARIVGLGDELTLRIEIQEPGTAFAIFARNLYARSSNGESLFLIDSNGCPIDPSIFPALRPDFRQPGSLFANFKAFRFPSSGMVNFEVQIRFCQDRCDPARCPAGGESFGRKRRQIYDDPEGATFAHGAHFNETRSPLHVTAHRPTVIIKQYPPPQAGATNPPKAPTTTSRPATTASRPSSTDSTTLQLRDTTTGPATTVVVTVQTDGSVTTEPVAEEVNSTETEAETFSKVTMPNSTADEPVTAFASTVTSTSTTGEENVTTETSADHAATEPPILFRKQEMYSPEENKNDTSGEKAIMRHSDGLLDEQAASGVLKMEGSERPPNKGGSTSLPPDLTSLPYGGYGMGYGRHYPQPPEDLVQPEKDVSENRGSSRNGRMFGQSDRSPFGGYGSPGHRAYQRSDQPQNDTSVGRTGYYRNGAPDTTQGTTAAYRSRDGHMSGYGSPPTKKQTAPHGNIRHLPPDYKPDPRNTYWFDKNNDTAENHQNNAIWRKISTSSGSNKSDGREDLRYPPPSLQEIVATTEPPYPEEVPLSLAIVVGEENGARVDNGWRDPGNYHPPRSRKREPTVPPRAEEDLPCDPQNTIIITALVVSAIHVGLMLGGLFCFRWQRRSLKRRQLISDFQFAPAPHSAVTVAHQHRAAQPRPMVYGKADMSFRQMYGEFETPP